MASEVSKGFVLISTYLCYATLLLFGHLRDTFGKVLGMGRYFASRAPVPKVRRCKSSGQYLMRRLPPLPLFPPHLGRGLGRQPLAPAVL